MYFVKTNVLYQIPFCTLVGKVYYRKYDYLLKIMKLTKKLSAIIHPLQMD